MSERGFPARRLSRRRVIAALTAAAGTLAVEGGRIGAAPGTPSPEVTQSQVPQDPTKEQGPPLSELGFRSPFFQPRLYIPSAPQNTQGSAFTPLQDLDGIITPWDLHYQRDHAGSALVDPRQHRLLIHGMVDRPLEFSLEDLKRFPRSGRIMFLECSGNSGAAWGKTTPEATAQSIHGLTSTQEWIGVPVKTLLNEVGVKSGATWALAEGADGAVMDRSIPLEKLMDDAFIAYGQNGEDLRVPQGYPMRLMLPGWEGNTNIKWLRRLELGSGPWQTREETSKYTDPMPDGKARQFTFAMEVKSLITFPSSGHVLPALGPWEIRGIAWSGRGKISKVEVSTDNGSTWNEASLDQPVLPICHTRFRYMWSWDGGEATIMSRATDETGQVQPTKAQLVQVRGTQSIYHFNGIQPWKVGKDGKVTNALQ